MKNSFQQLESAFEAKFEAHPAIEAAIVQNMVTTNMFGQMAQLFIPVAAGALVKMTTGTDVPQSSGQPQQPFGHAMPDLDWRYKVAQSAMPQPEHPRDRFQPFIPF